MLSCTLSDRIAAIGLVAAAETLPWSWCEDHRPMPMIAFHGTADPIIPYKGGHSPLAPERFPDVQTWVSNWAQTESMRVDARGIHGRAGCDASRIHGVRRQRRRRCSTPSEAAVIRGRVESRCRSCSSGDEPRGRRDAARCGSSFANAGFVRGRTLRVKTGKLSGN